MPVGPEALRGPDSAKAPGPVRFGAPVEPGQTRTFPLLGILAPPRLRLDLALPSLEERAPPGRQAAEVWLEFQSGPPVPGAAPIAPRVQVPFDVPGRKGEPLGALVVKNRLTSQPLLVDALYGESDQGTWTPLPLPCVTPSDVPLDIWQDRPATHILAVPPRGTLSIDVGGKSEHRLWLALKAEGAYPITAQNAEVAAIRVRYADGQPGPELRLVNGRDVETPAPADPERIAVQWEDANQQLLVYTLHTIDLDPARPVQAVEVSDLGVLPALAVAALTVGRRRVEAPPQDSGLRLEGSRLVVREERRAGWSPLGFSVRSPRGGAHATGRSSGVTVARDLRFGPEEGGVLEAVLPGTPWLEALASHDAAFVGGAALLLAFAAVVQGASLLARARRLRVKMLAALAAATVVPLVFLVVSLTRILNVAAEDDLREATLGALRSAGNRIAARKARATDLALAARDILELVPMGQTDTLERHVSHTHEEIAAKGAFLRLPELDPTGPSPLGNAAFFDRLARPGLYWSAWDGLVAVGFARTADQHRCIVGLPAKELVADAPPGATVVLTSPEGDLLAASGTAPAELRSPAARERNRARFEEALRLGRPAYDARAALGGGRAAACTLLRESGQPLALLSVYSSRTATDDTKAATLRTLLLSTLAALFLVVVAGGTLVDRVTHRLQRVTRAARAIAAGDLGNRAPVEEEDEVGRLALSFNTMADALDERVRQLTELHRGLHELTGALDRAEVARAACSLLARATGASSVQVSVLDAAGEGLELLHRRGEGAPLGARLPPDGPARDAVELKRSVVREGGAYLPLIAGGRVVGLAVCTPIDRDRDPDRAFLDASSRQIGIALENARLYHAAVTDELTGLYTLPFFVRRLKEEVDRAAAAGRPLSLLRIVISDLRGLARRHGAAAAAKAVAESAAALEEVLPRRRHARRAASPGSCSRCSSRATRRPRANLRDRAAAALRARAFGLAETPEFGFRTVSYPEDGAAADMLLDALFEATETWEEARDEPLPALKVPPELGLVASRSPTMRVALDVVARVAPTNATVLLSRRDGTGKEVLADLIHAEQRTRAAGPLRQGQLRRDPGDARRERALRLRARRLHRRRRRRSRAASRTPHGGTLFLDEVGELPLPRRRSSCAFSQERRFRPRRRHARRSHVDVRVIAATNRDLGEAVRGGTFREDLYHRLHVVEMRVPPLRERREDIPHLIDHFRQLFNASHGLRVETFAPDALDALYSYAWPGNVRELKNVVERTMLMRAGTTVERTHLALPAGAATAPPLPPSIDGLTPRQERILKLARDERRRHERRDRAHRDRKRQDRAPRGAAPRRPRPARARRPPPRRDLPARGEVAIERIHGDLEAGRPERIQAPTR